MTMRILDRMRRQSILYWPPAPYSDAYGKPVFNIPILLRVRIEDKVEERISAEGRIWQSKNQFYVGQVVEMKGVIFPGGWLDFPGCTHDPVLYDGNGNALTDGQGGVLYDGTEPMNPFLNNLLAFEIKEYSDTPTLRADQSLKIAYT